MYDDKLNTEMNHADLLEKRTASGSLLMELIKDYEDKIFSIRIQLKTQLSLLQERERELIEKERVKIHNRDLFSPIYSKASDTSNLLDKIDQIKQGIVLLNEEQDKLNEKIDKLKTAAAMVDQVIKESLKESAIIEQEIKPLMNDKGLSILEAQEIDRQRIACDLHDTTVQNLTSLVHKSELCVKLIDIDAIRAKLELNSMGNTLKNVINDMRGIIYNLKPMTLEDLGLTVTVERFACRLMEANDIQIRVQTNNEVANILPVIKLSLFRVIQESCNNVIKHAKASLIIIDISYDEKSITISIKDNGCGFDLSTMSESHTKSTTSFGLSIMRERIALLSGKLEITSEIGKGTEIIVTVPNNVSEGGYV